MSFVFKKDTITKLKKPNYLSYKVWRYLYLLMLSSVHRKAEKKYWSRRTTVVSAFVGDDFIVYSGKRWHIKRINPWMVGFKLGEFTWNRRLALYKAKQLRKKLAKQKKNMNKNMNKK